jgi:hypothetical protein
VWVTALGVESSVKKVLYVAKGNEVVPMDIQLGSTIDDIFDHLQDLSVEESVLKKHKKFTFIKLETKFIFYIQFFRKVVLVKLRMYNVLEG